MYSNMYSSLVCEAAHLKGKYTQLTTRFSGPSRSGKFLTWRRVPGLPLVVALAGMTTRVRSSNWRTIVLWVVAAAATLIVLAPFIIGLFDLNIVEAGPATPAGPAG